MKSYLILLLYLCSSTIIGVSTANEDCNYRLTAPKGIIQTPNFPKAFPVPIKCRWVIDVSEITSIHSSIIVYMTQLYVYKGLKLTEYAYYESDTMNYGASLVQEITEGNVFAHHWFRTYRPFLVLEFELDRLEGNHVRVLDDLLNVYGFNITYQMTDKEPNPNACSVSECSFTGNCLLSADYTTFTCECFTDFSGEKCNVGPLCFDEQQNSICQNGGHCKHIGAKAVRCDCPFGYVGEKCEVELLESLDKKCGENNCILQCPYHEEDQRPCACKNVTKVFNNRSRYESKIKLSNITSLRSGSIAQHGSLESFLAKQLTKYLKSSNISSTEDLKILNVTPTSELTIQFFGNSDDGDKVRESLNRLVQRRRLGEIPLESTHFTFRQRPTLRLEIERLGRSNNNEMIHVGDKFILHCYSYGSYGIRFFWYKDNMLVNVSKANRGIRQVDDSKDGLDIHTSNLQIDEMTMFDAGQFTCQGIDRGVQQCKSHYVQVKNKPDVKVTPMSTTVEKGNNIELTCRTSNMHNTGIGFGWTKNQALLKLKPGSEIWEDLHPDGSILKITNIQKSAIYTCNVAQWSMSVRVDITNRSMVPMCSKENSWSLQWPDTAPGSEALLECPRHFVGPKVSRLCWMKDATTPEWTMPDFSKCLYEPLNRPYESFQILTLGYQNTTGSETIKAFWNILQSRKLSFYPNEGDRILSILAEIEQYQFIIDPSDLHRSAEALTRIVNRILNEEYSILSPKRFWTLLQTAEKNLIDWSKTSNRSSVHLSLSSMVVDIQPLQSHESDSIVNFLQIPTNDYTYPDWYNDNVAIRLWKKGFRYDKSNSTYKGIVIVYKNISSFIPNVYVKTLDDSTDLEYWINSHAITVTVPSYEPDKQDEVFIDLQMKQFQNNSGSWNVTCSLMDYSGTWNFSGCTTNTFPEDDTIYCSCSTTGTVALFLNTKAAKVNLAHIQKTIAVSIGCGSCLAQCLLTLIMLGIDWWKNRTCLNFLKMLSCSALIGAMSLFLYALHGNINDSNYPRVAIGLEAFLLIGMSVPVSEALIIYSQLIHIQTNKHIQPTVIAVITGVPFLAALATELTHKSTGWRHESWWLIYGSGVYFIFTCCAAAMLCVFITLYMVISCKGYALMDRDVTKRKAVMSKFRLMNNSAATLGAIIATEVSSIFYINAISSVYHYIFALLTFLLGFIIVSAYITTSDFNMFRIILRRCKRKTLKTTRETKPQPIKVCSKIEVEVHKDVIPLPPSSTLAEPYTETRGVTAGNINMRQFTIEAASYSKASPSVGARHLPEIRVDRPDDINLENYNTSPRKYQEATGYAKRTFRCITEPYGVTDRSGVTDHRDCPINQNVSSERLDKLLCSADIELRLSSMPDVTLAVKTDGEHLTGVELKGRENVVIIPDIANTTERKQPEGEDKMPQIRITNCESTTSGMMDRISHDLDYLLNRTHAKEEV